MKMLALGHTNSYKIVDLLIVVPCRPASFSWLMSDLRVTKLRGIIRMLQSGYQFM